MLPRQLRRPLLRSVTAAAWRPATLSPAVAAPYNRRGDSRSTTSSSGNSSSSSNNSDLQQKGEKEGEARETTTTSSSSSSSDQHGDSEASRAPIEERKPSLFEQLLPEEAKAKLSSSSSSNVIGGDKNRWSFLLPSADEEPPRLALPEDSGTSEAKETGEGPESPTAHLENEAPDFYTPATRAKSMLILSGASKTLQESDFQRLGVRGKHVDGWVGPGILKVIQARDPDTLEPKGHYFILFDSSESASAYLDRIFYLWSLGKTHVPGAHHARRHMQQQPLPRKGRLWRTENGEDVAHLIRTFNLVPPSQRLSLVQSRMDPHKITQMYLEGGFVHQLAVRAGSKFLVLVRLDGGRLSVDTLRRAIRDDGERRRLEWRITDLEKGILAFGKSILKAKDRVHVPEVESSSSSSSTSSSTTTTNTTPGADGPSREEGFNDEILDEKEYSEITGQTNLDAAREAEKSNEKYRQYPRFIIPFVDQAEAHRFVQNWHRRELKLRLGATGKKRNDLSWEETRIINATVLW